MAPVGVPALMGEPLLHEMRRALEPLAPLRPPAGARDRRIGRERVPRQHAIGPLGHVHRDHEPAAVVHVVGVAVVARVDADDRAERRRRARRELESVEPAPRRPHHADVPVAPGLLGQPGDHLEPVQLLLLGVFVLDDPVRVARAANVDAGAAVAVPGEPGHLLVVAGLRPVAQPVGQVLEDRRHASGALGQPEPRRQTGAVRERDPLRLDDAHRVRQVVAHARFHGARLDGRSLTGAARAQRVRSCAACSPACSSQPRCPQRRAPALTRAA